MYQELTRQCSYCEKNIKIYGRNFKRHHTSCRKKYHRLLIEEESSKKETFDKECPICEVKMKSSVQRHMDTVHKISCGEDFRYVLKNFDSENHGYKLFRGILHFNSYNV